SEGIDFQQSISGRYTSDPLFRKVLDHPDQFKNFEWDQTSKLLHLKKEEFGVLCIPRILINGRSAQEIVISEAHSMLAHLGSSKTLEYLCQHIWWK
ncbi:hypothetical protein ARMGADRAFT_855623, partial [Armillaria gallica]